MNHITYEQAVYESALFTLSPAGLCNDEWAKVGMAAKDAGISLEAFDDWCAGDPDGYPGTAALRSRWKSWKPGKVTAGTLIHLAKESGWEPDTQKRLTDEQAEARRQVRARIAEQARLDQQGRYQKAAALADKILNAAEPASEGHPYLIRKGVNGARLYQMPADDLAKLLGYCPKSGGEWLEGMILIAPVKQPDGTISTLELIDEQGRKAALAGGKKAGGYWLSGALPDGDGEGSTIAIAEGIATAKTVHEAIGGPVLAALSCHNLIQVAEAMRQRYPAARLLVCGDLGNGQKDAEQAAASAGAMLAIPAFPEGSKKEGMSDFNDLHQQAGIDAVRQQVEAITMEQTEMEVVRPKFPMVQRYGNSTYKVDADGVWFIVEDGDAAWICSPLLVTAKTRDAQSGSWGRLLEWMDDDGVEHRWAMPLNMLEGDTTEMRKELADQGLTIAAGRKAGDLLASYIKCWKVEERARCVDRLGWHGETYMLPDKAVGNDAEKVVFQSKYATDPGYGVAGTLGEWRDNVARFAGGNTRMMFGISAAFSGPLAYLANEDSGGFHLRGDSSTGKSTAIKIASSVWGHPDQYTRQWAATKNGLEGMAAVHNDNLLALDEIGECDPRDVGEAVYMLGNGKGKARANRTGMVRQSATWRTIFLSSGETTLAALMALAGRKMNAGQGVRLADFQSDAECGHGAFDVLHGHKTGAALALALKDNSCRFYGAAGVAWLKWIVAHRKDLPDLLTERIDSFITDAVPARADGQVYRVAKRFGLVAAAGELATEAGLTGWKHKEAECAVMVCFESWFDGFGGGGKSEERALLAQVRAFFESHGASRFEDWLATSEQRVINRAGFFRANENGGKTYYVLPEAFRRDVCEGFDAKRAAQTLVEKGWITGESNRVTQKPRLPGIGPTRCYVFTDKMWESEE